MLCVFPTSPNRPHLFVSCSAAFHADLWPRRTVFRLRCVVPTSPDRPHLFVSCSIVMQTPILPVVYCDDHLIAVAKPSGMFVHRTDEDRSDTQVVLQLVREHVGSFVYSIHRLDRGTSGLVLLGLTMEAASRMNKLFANREVSKTYLALVRGHCPKTGLMDMPLVSSRGRGQPADHPHAHPQEAETRFSSEEYFELPIPCQRYATTRCTLVRVRPLTGRFHQIRRHFNYASHPIIGDTSHGDSRHNTLYRRHFGLDRLMLAAVELHFVHPFTGEAVTIEYSPDESFSQLIETLRTRTETSPQKQQSRSSSDPP